MDPILINLNDYVPAGEGANGESYNHRTDEGIMLKLYFPGKIQQPLDEIQIARKVYDAGIPSPEPGDFVVTGDGRYGIRFRRVLGKKSIARAISDDPVHVADYARLFAGMCLKLHATTIDTSQFESVKCRYLRLLDENPFFTIAEKDKLERFITDAPDAPTAIHGDLHFGNLIFTGDQNYFIDLGDFCYGYPLFDVGMVYVTSILSGSEFRKVNFHIDDATSARFWEFFAQAYFGSDRPLASIVEEVLPYAGLKTLIIERDTKCPMPEFRAALKSII
ncbi:MAG: phosphotransferase [Bacteroidales bacterium]|nr:phosphotransferase [Bacteroidales bacterium]